MIKKKTVKKLLSTMLCAIIVAAYFVPLNAFAASNTGKIGAVKWSLDGTVLTISGNGEMANIPSHYMQPWGTRKITEVIIEEGVTKIGRYAFHDCSVLTKITIPKSVNKIDIGAFAGCTALKRIYITDIAAWCNIEFSPTNLLYSLFLNGKEVNDIVIPDAVWEIKAWAFSGCTGLKSVTLSNGIMSIGNSAFSGCTGLESITIPDSVIEIGEEAFDGCNIKKLNITEGSKAVTGTIVVCKDTLEEVNIPNSVTNIAAGAFSDCKNLVGITIPDSVESIGIGAFKNTRYYNDDSNWDNDVLYISNCLIENRNKDCESYAIKNGTKVIADYAFAYCEQLRNITLPDSIRNIGKYAFTHCRLRNITIPKNLNSVGDRAFYMCFLNKVNITDLVKWCNVDIGEYGPLSNGAKLYLNGTEIVNLVIPEEITTIKTFTFSGCTSITSISIPNGVTEIGSHAFSFCVNLKNVTIPNTVTSIGGRAFCGCSGMSKIVIPNSVINIGRGLFIDCKNLTDITLPNSITSISDRMFRGCTELKNIIIPDSVTQIEDEAFINTGLTSIAIPKNVTEIGSYAFSGCTGLTSIIIPDNVKSIGERAFYKCYNLKEIVLSENLESINEYTFNACSSLTNIIIPNSVTNIERYAFTDCKKLTSVTVSDGLTNVNGAAFLGCNIKELNISKSSKYVTNAMVISKDTLERVNIQEGVTHIKERAFEKCSKLASVVIPKSVTGIGAYAFSGCTGLTNITIPNSVVWIGDYAFYNCSELISVKMPDAIKSVGIGKSAFSGCVKLADIAFPIAFSGTKAFENCRSLTNLPIADGFDCVSMEKGMFSGCTGLKNITIPNSIRDIYDYAFSGCTGLTSITILNDAELSGDNIFLGCDKTKLVIYTDSTQRPAYKYAKANGYLCRVIVDGYPNLQYSVDNDTLEIFGAEKTPDFNLFSSTPWYDFRDNITKIIIDENIAEIGAYNFYGFNNLEVIETKNSNLKFNTRSINTNNKNISVYSTGSGALEKYCKNNSVNFVKPPETPVLKTVTENTVEVQNENGFEYSLDKINWQESGIFKELKPVTQYAVYVRRKNGYTPFKGKPLIITTTKRIISAPVAPKIENYASNSVTLSSGYEYSSDGINWQKSNIFNRLSLNKIYSFYQRIPENSTDFPSEISKPLYFSLPDRPEILKVGATTLTVKPIDGYEYSLDKIDWQSSNIFTDLVTGMNYTVYQRIAKSVYSNSYQIVSEGTTVCVNGIDKTVPSTPSAPIVLSKTANSVTLKEISGYEYSADGKVWQNSNVFTGLNEDTEYTFYQRIAETKTAYASESSAALKVRTDKSYTPGDLDGDEKITDKDAIYLLMHSYFPEDYPVNQPLDYNNDGLINDKDAIYLLMHCYFPEDYPITK